MNNKKNQFKDFITYNKFEQAYVHFMEQAEKNAISGKSEGSRTPFGFVQNNTFYGSYFLNHYGQGSSSKTPYMNWSVVSLYYVIENNIIIIGIENNRYENIDKLIPIKNIKIGRKKIGVSVFYEANKNNLYIHDLYNKFIDVCQRVLEIDESYSK